MAAAKRVETHMATSCGFAHGILVFQTVFSKAFYSRNLRRLQTRIALFVWHFQVTLKKMKTSALWTSIGIGNGSFLLIPFLCQCTSYLTSIVALIAKNVCFNPKRKNVYLESTSRWTKIHFWFV